MTLLLRRFDRVTSREGSCRSSQESGNILQRILALAIYQVECIGRTCHPLVGALEPDLLQALLQHETCIGV